MKSSKFPLLSSALVSALLWSCPTHAGDDVIGKMGTVEIHQSEVQKLLENLSPATANNETLHRVLVQSLRAELLRKSILKEALRQEWDKRPEVQARIERAKEDVVVSSFMNNAARPEPGYPSEAEIKKAYEANAKLFVQPPEVRLAQIFIPEDANAAPMIEDIWKQTQKKGADFGDLARKYSKHAESAQKAGEMGWIAEDLLTPETRGPVKSMAVGDISKPIKSSSGWHILRLEERRAAAQQPLDSVRDQLATSLRLQMAQQNEARYLDQLVSQTPISINEIALGALLPTRKPR